jgi:ankyrin repeat protein
MLQQTCFFVKLTYKSGGHTSHFYLRRSSYSTVKLKFFFRHTIMTFHQVPVDTWGIIASFVSYGHLNPILYLSKTVHQAILKSLATEKTCVDFYMNFYTDAYVLKERDDYLFHEKTRHTLHLPRLGQIVLLLLKAHALKCENIELLRDICKRAISFGHTNIVTLLYSSEYDVSKGLPSQYYSHDRSWEEAMYNALKRKYVDLVQFFLTAGWDPTLHKCYRGSPLHYSLTLGHIEVARLLFTGGFYSPNDVTRRTLRRIASEDYGNVLEFLFEYEDVDVFRMCKQAWRVAVIRGSVKVMKILLRYLDPSSHNNAAIKNTVKVGKVEMAKLLLQDERTDPGANENEVLCIAIKNDKFEVMKILLRYLDPSSHDNAAIKNTVRAGKVEMARLLLQDERTNPGANENEALCIAIKNDEFELMNILLQQKGIDPSAFNNIALRTAILTTNTHSTFNSVTILLNDARVDPTANNHELLMFAFSRNRYASAIHLIKDGRIDPSVDNNAALFVAIDTYGDTELVRLLLADLRVDPSARSNQAIVDATMYVRHSGSSELVEVLLTDPRVDPSVQDFKALYNVLKFHKEDLLVGMLQRVDKKHVEYVSTKFFSYVAEFYPSMLKFVEQYCANEL